MAEQRKTDFQSPVSESPGFLMDKQHFDQLVKVVRQMNRHRAGKAVRGAKATELAEPDVRAIREAAKRMCLRAESSRG